MDDQLINKDVVLVAQLYDVMRISHEDLVSPDTMMKMEAVMDFAGSYIDAVPRIRQAMMKKPADAPSVDYIFNYIALQGQRVEKQRELEAIENEIAMYE